MKGASGTPDPPCVSDRPRMSEYPNVRIIPSYAQAVRREDRPSRGIHRRPTLRRRFATPVDAVDAADADGRERTRRLEHLCDANVFRRRDDANPDARRRGRARARANADWTPRRRGARRSQARRAVTGGDDDLAAAGRRQAYAEFLLDEDQEAIAGAGHAAQALLVVKEDRFRGFAPRLGCPVAGRCLG